MITANEWHRANVYTAPITNSRVSKLSALCGIEMPNNIDGQPDIICQTQQEPDIDLNSLG